MTDEFQTYKAINEFNFGPLGGITIKEGQRMEFDGTTLKLSGRVHGCPEFDAAIRAGFVVKASDVITAPPAPVAHAAAKVRQASSFGEHREFVDMGTVVEDEQVVGSLASTANKRTAAQAVRTEQITRQPAQPDPEWVEPALGTPQNPEFVTPEEADRRNEAAIRAELAKPVNRNYIRGGTLQTSVLDDDEKPTGKYGVVVADGASQGEVGGRVRSGQNSAVVGSEGEALRKVLSRGVDVTRLSSDSVESGLQEQRVVEGIRGVKATTSAIKEGIQSTGARVISTEEAIRQTPPKPMRKTTVITEGDDIRELGPDGSTGDVSVQTAGDDLIDLLPDAVVAGIPRTPPKPQRSNPEDELAEIREGWDLKRQWRKRVKEAVDFYADWPEALAVIYELESPAVVKHIKSQLGV